MKATTVVLSILMALLSCPSPGPAEPRHTPITLSLPDLKWALEINAPDFDVEIMKIAPKSDATYIFATNKKTGVILSAFLEKAARSGNSQECRDYYWNKVRQIPLKKEQIKMYDLGAMAVVEYIIPEHLGMKLNQKNLNAYLARDNHWIDIYLSKVGFEEGQQDLFQRILSAVKINDAYTPTAFDFFQFGNLSYFRKDYQRAITFYQKALAMEEQQKILGRKGWIVLVDQLGISYRISGDLLKAKETYEWAIQREQEYPMFFYNLACTYAEMNNMSEAIRYLRLAYKFKGNMWSGETIPDPGSDSSFKKYLNDHHFMEELKKMKQKPSL